MFVFLLKGHDVENMHMKEFLPRGRAVNSKGKVVVVVGAYMKHPLPPPHRI